MQHRGGEEEGTALGSLSLLGLWVWAFVNLYSQQNFLLLVLCGSTSLLLVQALGKSHGSQDYCQASGTLLGDWEVLFPEELGPREALLLPCLSFLFDESFPGGSAGIRICLQCRRHRFNP